MFNTDMILWQANGKNSKGVDLWSRGHFSPDIDSHQDWETTFEENSTHVSFTSYRRYVTFDSSEDQFMPEVNDLKITFYRMKMLNLLTHIQILHMS